MEHSEIKSRLHSLDPYEFENFVGDFWEHRGWKTEVTKKSQDEGVDIVATKMSPFREKQLIQVKQYSEENKIGGPEIRQYDALRRFEENVDAVVVVTTSSFTKSAEDFAKRANIKILDIDALCDAIKELNAVEILNDYTEGPRSILDSAETDSQESNSVQESSESDEYASLAESADDALGTECPYCGDNDGLLWDETGTYARCQECRAGIKLKEDFASTNYDYEDDTFEVLDWEYFNHPAE